MSYFTEVEALTLELVKISSINNTEGEKILAEHIAGILRSWDYFRQHPSQVWEVPLENDSLGRKNVFALVKGNQQPAAATVILHGHLDTVGVEDFGSLQDAAFDPGKLTCRLMEEKLSEDVRADLLSGDWMFGRGAVDMKSGVAAHLAVLKHLSEQVETFAGNVLFMANPVEENQHTGIMEALPVLQGLAAKENLSYVVAINNDYTAPLYQGDPNRYIYLGAVGKLLPCFYIVGKETHVGNCFAGLDPALISAEILKRIDLNTELCDVYKGEMTLPPTALKAADLKPTYNVQTPLAAFLYFNYFTHDQSSREVLAGLKEIAKEAFAASIDYVETQHKKYCGKAGVPFISPGFKPKVLTYEELYREVKAEQGETITSRIRELVARLTAEGKDSRLICLAVVEELKHCHSDPDPVVVVYFSPPYCPHNTVKGQNANERSLIKEIEDLTREFENRYGEKFLVRQFFPALSDSSYLNMEEDEASIQALINNFPEWHTIYPVPVKLIQQTNIPAVNFGVYGKDAHSWTERVYKPYSFQILPELVEAAVLSFLKK